MDDPRTRESLDALADLFLTGVAEPGPADAPGRAKRREAPADDPAPPHTDADSPLDGPEPLRLRPKLGPARAPGRDAARDHADNPPDAEADAEARTDAASQASPGFPRLHRTDAPAPADGDASPLAAIASADERADAAAAPADLVVEGVLLGNLPGVSGPWLTQYAQLLAQHDGSVAVLHLDAGSAELELVEPADAPDREVPRAFRPPRTAHSAQTLGRVLRELTRDPEAPVRTLLVHAPAEPASAARLAEMELWTLVCGADDAAVVAGYRLLKSLITAVPASAAKQIGLMVMGSDEPTSRRAADKFASASASFLHVPVQLVGWQQRMLPVNVRQLGRFDLDDAQCARLLAELTEAPAAPPRDETPRPQPTGPAPTERPTPADTLDDDEAIGLAPEPPEADEPEGSSSPARARPAAFGAEPGDADDPPYYDLRESAEPAPAAERPARPERPRGREPEPKARRQPRPESGSPPPAEPGRASAPRRKPRPAPAADHRASGHPETGPGTRPEPESDAASAAPPDAAPDLAALLAEADPDFAGAVALEARCPQHPQVQLALDQSGRVHLLAHHDGEAADGLHGALVELLQVRAWAAEHRDLLALTQRQLRFDPGLSPALHLFTGAARLAVGLSARLPADLLRLHLLQGVELDGDTAWLATPLS